MVRDRAGCLDVINGCCAVMYELAEHHCSGLVRTTAMQKARQHFAHSPVARVNEATPGNPSFGSPAYRLRTTRCYDGRLTRPRVDGRTVARTAVVASVSIGVRAASGCHTKRAEVDETIVVCRATAAGVRTFRSADAGKSAAVPDVMLEMSNVMTAFAGLLIGSHRAGRHPDGQRQHCANKRKPCRHHPSAFFGPNSATVVTGLT